MLWQFPWDGNLLAASLQLAQFSAVNWSRACRNRDKYCMQAFQQGSTEMVAEDPLVVSLYCRLA